MRKKANHPQWTLDQKRPGTELRCIRGKYYLYECSSFYDKEKKKTRKKTGAYLGMITEDDEKILLEGLDDEIKSYVT